MRLDNSQFAAYMKCPQFWYEHYEADNSDVQRSRDRESLYQIQPAAEGGTANGPVGVVLANDADHNHRFAERGIELDEPAEGRDFGTRLHQLLHERRLRGLGFRAVGRLDKLEVAPGTELGASLHREGNSGLLGPQPSPAKEFVPTSEWPDERIESEAQATLAAYEAHYVRDYNYLESERTHIVPLDRRCPYCAGAGHRSSAPGRADDQRVCGKCAREFTMHELIVKIDAVVEHADETLGPMDTKSESKPGYNTREDWAGRTQAKAYLWALRQILPNRHVSRLVVDVVTRASPKQRRGPIFTRIDDISCAPPALEEAIRNFNYVADRIEEHRRTGFWPANMNICKRGWERCDYYLLHVDGRTEANLRKFRPAEDYLSLET
jgi:hypothetical protein